MISVMLKEFGEAIPVQVADTAAAAATLAPLPVCNNQQ